MIYVILTTADMNPWIEVGEIKCVIDCGLCQLPCYNDTTDSVSIGHCIASQSMRLQRHSRLGKTCPGLLISMSPRPGGRICAYPEILRIDLSWGVMILEDFGCSFPGLSLPDAPSASLISKIQSSLLAIRAICPGGKLTQFGQEILKYPHSLSAIYVAIMIRYSIGRQDPQEQQLYLGIVFLVISSG
jgi:HrpA-like RNA helicase